MWIAWRIFVTFLLLVYCKAELDDDDYKFVDEVTNSRGDSTNEVDDLRRELALARKTIEEQANRIKELLATQTKIVDTNEKSCGQSKVCVKKGHCKTEAPDSSGYYKITFRSAFDSNPCHYLEDCCHIDDKIESVFTNESTDNDDFPACGTQHIRGINMTFEATPNMEAEFGEFPWMVALMMVTDPNDEPELIGGGSLIAPNVVMTAAHKLNNTSVNELVVRAGEWDLKTKLEIYPHVDRGVKQVILHNNYSPNHKEYNIALLVLKVRISPNPHITPICLPSSPDSFDPTGCVVTGWGKSNYSTSDYPHILKEITMPLVPRQNCSSLLSRHLRRKLELDQTSICAGGEKNKDSCIGDGGAPLVCPIKGVRNRYYQVGIVAWGLRCGLENIPGVYTDVSFLMPWIAGELRKLNVDSRYYSLTL